MNNKLRKGLSLTLFLLGLIIFATAPMNITGAVIGAPQITSGITSLIGIVLMFAALMVFTSQTDAEVELEDIVATNFSKNTKKINEFEYDIHALDRMEERKIFPSIIEDTIINGEHYELKNNHNFGEAKGATDVYIMRNSADIAPGGKIGERIIKAEPNNENRSYKNILVLCDENKTIKTVYVRTDNELASFFNRYI